MTVKELNREQLDNFDCNASTGVSRAILFTAGYHEWNVFIDDNCVYSFEDFGECVEAGYNRADIENLVDDSIAVMIEEKQIFMSEVEKDNLKNQMVEKLSYHYLDDISIVDDQKSSLDDVIKSCAEMSKSQDTINEKGNICKDR